MFALPTILITLATWKAALMYYAREIKVLERNVAVLEDRIPTEATTVRLQSRLIGNRPPRLFSLHALTRRERY